MHPSPSSIRIRVSQAPLSRPSQGPMHMVSRPTPSAQRSFKQQHTCTAAGATSRSCPSLVTLSAAGHDGPATSKRRQLLWCLTAAAAATAGMLLPGAVHAAAATMQAHERLGLQPPASTAAAATEADTGNSLISVHEDIHQISLQAAKEQTSLLRELRQATSTRQLQAGLQLVLQYHDASAVYMGRNVFFTPDRNMLCVVTQCLHAFIQGEDWCSIGTSMHGFIPSCRDQPEQKAKEAQTVRQQGNMSSAVSQQQQLGAIRAQQAAQLVWELTGIPARMEVQYGLYGVHIQQPS